MAENLPTVQKMDVQNLEGAQMPTEPERAPLTETRRRRFKLNLLGIGRIEIEESRTIIRTGQGNCDE